MAWIVIRGEKKVLGELAPLSWTPRKGDNSPREVSNGETATIHQRVQARSGAALAGAAAGVAWRRESSRWRGDQLLRDDVDLSGITQLLQQMLAVLPRQPKGT